MKDSKIDRIIVKKGCLQNLGVREIYYRRKKEDDLKIEKNKSIILKRQDNCTVSLVKVVLDKQIINVAVN